MKELSIEQKAQRYDEAIEIAKDSYNYPSYPGFIRADVVFPELKESECEKIRKELIDFVKSRGGFKGECISWLEKQGEHKPADKVEPSFDEAQGTPIIKQEEHKPTDNIKPKFHEGDNIQFKGVGHNIYTIKKVCGLSHYLNTNGNRMDMSYTDANFEVIKDSDKVKLSPIWSEEDENLLNRCITNIQMVDSDDTLKIWLKSLKDRIQLK